MQAASIIDLQPQHDVGIMILTEGGSVSGMRKKNQPHWIEHSHFFDPSVFECSECGKKYSRKEDSCPNCKTRLQFIKDDLGWIEEEEELDLILEDD